MNKQTKKDFAKKIRSSNPGSYDDLSDDKLIQLWLKKFPNDKEKIIWSQPSLIENSDEAAVKEISSYFLKWIGIVVCVLAVVSFFIDSESLTKMILQSDVDHRLNDSSASNFLQTVEFFIIDVLIWLKKIPIAAKVAGLIVGGIIWFMNDDD